jgi:hypothetical protein
MMGSPFNSYAKMSGSIELHPIVTVPGYYQPFLNNAVTAQSRNGNSLSVVAFDAETLI